MPQKSNSSGVNGAGPARLAAYLFACALVVAVGALSANQSAAGWLTRIVKEAGDAADAGLDAGKIAAARGAPRHVARLADSVQRVAKRDPKAVVIGATGAGSGAWTFVNASGEVFTAANASELARVRSVLVPDANPRRATQLVIWETALFGDLEGLAKAVPDAELTVAVGRKATYKLRAIKTPSGEAAPAWRLKVRNNLELELTTRTNMTAALDVLRRPLRQDKLTVLALRQTTPKRTPTPLKRGDTAGIAGLEVGEGNVAQALRALRGRTVVLTGRVSADKLTYRTAQGFDRDIALGPVREAAVRNDVTLVLVNSATPRQPGVRNWLWQRASLAGFDKALAEDDLAGMVSGLSDGNGRMVAKVDATDSDRTSILVQPEASGLTVPGSDLIGDFTATVISETTGNVISKAIELDATSATRQSELDWRLIPWLPSTVQWGYIISIVAGLLGLPFLRAWWPRVWPPETAREYASRVGLVLARLVRMITFVLVFMPIAGIPAAIANVGYTVWSYFMLPFRMLFWIAAKFRRQPT